MEAAPAGSWILRRTIEEPNVVLVDYVHEEDAGVIVRTNAVDAATGVAVQSNLRTLR